MDNTDTKYFTSKSFSRSISLLHNVFSTRVDLVQQYVESYTYSCMRVDYLMKLNAIYRSLADCKSNYVVNYSSRVADVLINNYHGVQTKLLEFST